MIESGARTWRLGFEIYDGRVPVGEFYRIRKTTMTVGVWVDL